MFRKIVDSNEFLLEKKDTKSIARRSASWGNEELEYNDGMLEGTTVGSTPRGGHYNLVIGDDPLRDDGHYPEEYILDYFQAVLGPTTFRKKARYVIVGTPMNESDLFHVLMNSKVDKNDNPIGEIKVKEVSAKGFYCDIFPAITNEETKEVLIPEVWTYDELMKKKEELGDYKFQREMMCRVTSYKNSLVGYSLFKRCCDSELSIIQKGEKGKKYVIFVDSATSDAPTADFSAMTVWEDDRKNNKFILRHLFHIKGMPIIDPEGGDYDDCDQAHKLYQLYIDFNKAFVAVEKNNAGVTLIQAVRAIGEKRGEPIEVVEHYTHQPSSQRPGKVHDITEYINAMKNGVIVFPSNPEDMFTLEVLDKIKNEHLNFGVKQTKTGEKYEALAGHDDIFDSCYLAYKFRGDSVETIPFGMTLSGFN